MMNKVSIEILPPIVENSQFQINDCHSCTFRNQSENDVIIDSFLVLKQNEVFAFGAGEKTVFNKRFNIHFNGVNHAKNRLEIVIIKYI